MRAFVQAKNGMPIDYDHFNAACGFKEMGYEIVYFSSFAELEESKKEDIVVGYIGIVNKRLGDFNVKIEDIDYPVCLEKFLGRRIWNMTINEVSDNPDIWPVFVKPKINKKFSGRVIRGVSDLVGCGSCYDNAEVTCSDVLDIVSEYRAFVRYGQIVDVRRYHGDWKIFPDSKFIEQCVQEFVDAPAGYAIDFGVTVDGQTILIEVNNTCSIGAYGLYCVDYAKLISARWSELMDTEDLCNF